MFVTPVVTAADQPVTREHHPNNRRGMVGSAHFPLLSPDCQYFTIALSRVFCGYDATD